MAARIAMLMPLLLTGCVATAHYTVEAEGNRTSKVRKAS